MRDCLATYLIICSACSIIFFCASYLRGRTDPDYEIDPPPDPATIARINAVISQPGYKPADVRWAEHS